jgi:hypothetical protein
MRGVKEQMEHVLNFALHPTPSNELSDGTASVFLLVFAFFPERSQ